MSKVAPDSAKTSAPKPHYRCEELIKCVDFYSLTYTCWIIPRNKQTVLKKKKLIFVLFIGGRWIRKFRNDINAARAWSAAIPLDVSKRHFVLL